MTTMKQRKLSIALMALVLVFGACKGESPTAPDPGTGVPNQPPATGVTTLAVTASNANPLVDSTVVVTATVTRDGQPVPDGTAVEFASTGGGLDGSTATSLIKTTLNGVASVTLTSSVAGAVTVQATIANISRAVSVTFRTTPPVEPPPSTAPTIDSVTPAVGVPAGGQVIRITGKNFTAPVRVLFDIGQPLPVEGFVVASTATTIDVTTPSVNLGAGQQLEADIIVITRAGTANEQRVERAAGFTFRNESLTPRITTASPNSGPVTGGTLVTIFGDGFQAPVQVLFGAAEARVVTVEFARIIVEAPAGRDTSPDGSGTVTGFVPITVRNINSQTSVTTADAFRYIAAMQITAAGPTQGEPGGGTRVTIDGIGFVAPVAVTIGGVAAVPIQVSGTKIIAIAGAAEIEDCSDVSGPIVVTNIVNGDQAEGPEFTYRVPQPIIFNVSPSVASEGQTVTVTVAGAGTGLARIKIGERSVFPSASAVDEETGTVVYTLQVPTNIEFDTETCEVGGVEGEREVETSFDVVYENVSTGCEDTATDAITITPADGSCQVPPSPEVGTVTIAPQDGGGCAHPADATVGGASTTATITIQNTGSATLTVDAANPSGGNAASDFTVTPATRTIAPSSTGQFTVTFTPSAAGARNSNVTFTTNDADEGSVTVCLSGTGIAAP
jgi:hypothetical protein